MKANSSWQQVLLCFLDRAWDFWIYEAVVVPIACKLSNHACKNVVATSEVNEIFQQMERQHIDTQKLTTVSLVIYYTGSKEKYVPITSVLTVK